MKKRKEQKKLIFLGGGVGGNDRRGWGKGEGSYKLRQNLSLLVSLIQNNSVFLTIFTFIKI